MGEKFDFFILLGIQLKIDFYPTNKNLASLNSEL